MESEFDNACNFIRANSGRFEKVDLLYFYGRFKIATEGVCKTEKPAFYQLTEKSKWQAWFDLGDLAPETAKSEYVERLDDIVPDWRGEECKDPTSGWISVSCPQQEESLSDKDKTIWDWVKEGNPDKLKILVTADNIMEKDEDGLTLIHWASDRGHVDVVTFLHSVNPTVINGQDEEGQTPLHYAASCGHKQVVQVLLELGADPCIADFDDCLPNNSDTDHSIKDIFDSFIKS